MTTISALPTPPSRNDPVNFNTRADAFLGALPTFATETNTVASEVNTAASNAASSANTAVSAKDVAVSAKDTAVASALTAVNAPGTSSTSTTTMTIGNTNFTIVTQSGKAWAIGQQVIIASNASPAVNFMQGVVTGYNSGTGSLNVTVSAITGSGTYSDWTISLGALNSLTPTGSQDLSNKTLIAYLEAAAVVAASNIDLKLASVYSKTITANTTFTLSNLPASGKCQSLTLLLTNGGAFTVTLWSGVKWSGGTVPTLTAAGLDILEFFTIDGGTTWYASRSGKDVK